MVRVAAALVLAVVMFAGFAGAAEAEPLTPQAFTAAFAAAAAAALPAAKVAEAGDLHLETNIAGGGTVTTDLHNAYQTYLGDPARLDAVIRGYVAVLVEALQVKDGTLTIDRTHIVPVLKPIAWVRAIQQRRQPTPAKQLLTESFNGELMIVYAEDRPSAVRYLMTGDDVGDRSKLHDLALANLNRLLPKIEMRPGPDGISLISAGGEYEPSLLLADGIWSSGQIQVDGEIVAAVPAAGLLLVTGSHNRTGITRLRAIAAEFAAKPYGLTSALFVYRAGKWKEFADR
jgi:uncharacterized protein YtpQ (UPF0354 family)